MRIDEHKKTNFLIICFSVYLSYMTIQVSILDYPERSLMLFILFSFILYKVLTRFYNSFLDGMFVLFNSNYEKKEKEKLIFTFRKSWQIPAILLMLSSLLISSSIGYLFLKAAPYSMTGTNEGDAIYADYDSLAEIIWENSFSLLFAIVCLFPIIFFLILKFKEKFSLVDSLKYTILTTIIVFITLNILYKVAIFLYYTIGILMGGEN